MPSPGVLPPAFPADLPSNIKSLRFYETGAPTANYVDNQYAFERVDPKLPGEPEQGWCTQILVRAVGGDLTISFDGVTDHGFVPSGENTLYFDRYEGGISVKGTGTFHIEAW
jgi:hypothetical protein